MKLNSKRIMERAKNTLVAAGGGVGFASLNNFIPSSIKPKMAGGLKLLLAGALPEFMPKQKWLESFCDGGAGIVGVELAHAFGMDKITIAGIGEIGAHEIDEDYVDGPGDENISGSRDESVM